MSRTHQIRVHLKHRHTPIIGDETYGNVEWNRKYLRSNAIRRPLLHAYRTSFTHPFTGQEVVLTAPIPQDIADVLSKISTANTIFDPSTALLTCDVEVRGRGPGEKGRGFVPLDRLIIEEEAWTDIELPEEI